MHTEERTDAPEEFGVIPAAELEPESEDGWQALPAYLAGFLPDQVPPLVAAREVEPAFPLLHALARGSMASFFLRVAALEALVADGRSPLGASEIDEVLYWLRDPVREQVIKVLRGSGWIAYEPASGYRITEPGRFVAVVLSFLRAKVREGSLVPTVEGIEYMLRLGADPVRQVLLLRSQLEDLRAEMQAARDSHSEVILRQAVGRLKQATDLSERIRVILSKVPLELTEARRVAQDIHDLLSRLHGVGSELHAAITEVGRQYLRLVAGLTTTDIIATLMRLPVDELAEVGRSALRPVLPPVSLVVPELLAAQAEAYLARQREAPAPIEWTDPPPAQEASERVALPEEVLRLLDDLDRLAGTGSRRRLAEFVPFGSAGESFLRGSLLALLGERIGGEGVAGRLGSMPLAVSVEGDAFPLPAPRPLEGLSPGEIGPHRAAKGDGDG